ncbi:MAG: amidophosphoribosyltransferase [Pseudomonadota bacterium]
MCGIIGIAGQSPVNQLLYDGLVSLQHRGQDAAGIATLENGQILRLHKGSGLVRDVIRKRHMKELQGNWGIAHVRYPTAGSANAAQEAQPFYVNSPFGITLVHNGNLTNSYALKQQLLEKNFRHINTNSDSEVLLNIFAHEIQNSSKGKALDPQRIFEAISVVYTRIQGAYAVIAMIAGYGMIAFRDPYGIRPLILGTNQFEGRPEYIVASESVALDTLGFQVLRDIAPGEAIFIDLQGNIHTQQCVSHAKLTPCLFEYVYLARPDSTLDGTSVYATRLAMGARLADKIKRLGNLDDIDVVIPIPESSRPCAQELASQLNLLFREGFIKNRYIGRTFIMPGQAVRNKSVRHKLNPIGIEFRNRVVLLVDDSIVRGTTSREIVNMARAAGAKKVYFASAAPKVRYANVYGIDMPTQTELIAHGKTLEEIRIAINADALIYQDLDDLKSAIREVNPSIQEFEASCFNGQYVTGDIDTQYLTDLAHERTNAKDNHQATDDHHVADDQLSSLSH